MVNFYIYYSTHTRTYIYIYIYKITVNSKRYTSINRYRNISFHWSNRYNLQYEIVSLDDDALNKKIESTGVASPIILSKIGFALCFHRAKSLKH